MQAGILFHAQIFLVVGNHEGAKRIKRLVHGLVRPHPGLDEVAERVPSPQNVSRTALSFNCSTSKKPSNFTPFLSLVTLHTNFIEKLPGEVHVLVAFVTAFRLVTCHITHDLAWFILRTL